MLPFSQRERNSVLHFQSAPSFGLHKVKHNHGLHCIQCGKNGHEAKTCRIPWEKIKDKQEQKEGNNKAHEPAQYVISHCSTSINEELFKTSFASWRDVRLLDIGQLAT